MDRGESAEAPSRLTRSILARLDAEQVAAWQTGCRLQGAWPYGDLYAPRGLWERLGIPSAIARARGSRRVRFDVERALFVMVANRACASASQLHCFRQWLAEEVRLEGVGGLSLQHLYRAVDFLEAHLEELAKEIFWNTAQLLQLDTGLPFFDGTSLHWEIDGSDEGEPRMRRSARTHGPLRNRG